MLMYTYDRVSGSPVRVIIKPFKIVIAAVMVNVIIIGLCYNNVKKMNIWLNHAVIIWKRVYLCTRGPQILAFLRITTSGNRNIAYIGIEGLDTKFQENMSKTESRQMTYKT
jgi:hypothetical protein